MPKRGGGGRPWNRNNNNAQSYNGRSDYVNDKCRFFNKDLI